MVEGSSQFQHAGGENPVLFILEYTQNGGGNVVHKFDSLAVTTFLDQKVGHSAGTFQDVLCRCFVHVALEKSVAARPGQVRNSYTPIDRAFHYQCRTLHARDAFDDIQVC